MSVISFSDFLNGVFKKHLDHHYSPKELDELLQQFKSFQTYTHSERGEVMKALCAVQKED
jgi:hypothetical protein